MTTSRFDPDIHHRKTIRWYGYDYSRAGSYFLTICTHNKRHIFGHITDGRMVRNPYGDIALEEWTTLPEKFSHVYLDEYILMPNHLHAIITIQISNDTDVPADQTTIVGEPSAGATCREKTVGAPLAGALAACRATPLSLTVGEIVGAYKSRCVTRCLAWIEAQRQPVRLDKLWQRNYWEHVIRDDTEHEEIRDYIRQNIARWGKGDKREGRQGDRKGRPYWHTS